MNYYIKFIEIFREVYLLYSCFLLWKVVCIILAQWWLSETELVVLGLQVLVHLENRPSLFNF